MLYRNDIIVNPTTQVRVRVIHLDFAENEAWLFNLAGDNPLPKLVPLDQLELALHSQELVLEQSQGKPVRLSTSEAAKKARNQAYEQIRPLVETTDILIPKLRNALINQRAEETGASARTLIRQLRQWWANGQSPDALLPAFHRRGSTGGETANRGRPPKYEDRPIYQVTGDDLELFKKVAETQYLDSEVHTLAGAHNYLLDEYFTRVDGEGKRFTLPDGEFPTYMQFRRAVLAAFPLETIIRKRKGDSEYELNDRPVLGSLHAETYTVGDVFEIDATIADVFLVSSKNRAKIIGKPTLYLIVDRKSWLIVGFYVGLESASWWAALQAILSIAEDKSALCQRYGVLYDPDDWPAHGVLPKEFVADRGELLSKNSTAICEGLETNVRNLPKKRADHKPFVECSFKLIHQPISQAVPGYEPPRNVTKRQGKHYEQDACLTLNEFTKVILQAIIRHNRSPRSADRLSAEQVLEGNLLPIPVDIWNTEIRQRAGALSRVSEERMRFALLPERKAVVSREGIQLGSCYYNCPEAMQRGWHDIAARGVFEVTVSYDRRLVDSIFVHDPLNPEAFFTATILDKCKDYRGLSFAEVEAIDYYRASLNVQGKKVKRQTDLDFNQVVKPLSAQAHAKAKDASKGKSRTSRKADIVDDRKEELQRERQSRAKAASPLPRQPSAEVIALPVAPSINTPPPADTPESRRQAMFMKMLNGY